MANLYLLLSTFKIYCFYILVRDGIVQRVPPSRPAPMYDKPTLKVTFDTTTPTRVLSAVGQTAYLHCRVQHLGDKVVSDVTTSCCLADT